MVLSGMLAVSCNTSGPLSLIELSSSCRAPGFYACERGKFDLRQTTCRVEPRAACNDSGVMRSGHVVDSKLIE